MRFTNTSQALKVANPCLGENIGFLWSDRAIPIFSTFSHLCFVFEALNLFLPSERINTNQR